MLLIVEGFREIISYIFEARLKPSKDIFMKKSLDVDESFYTFDLMEGVLDDCQVKGHQRAPKSSLFLFLKNDFMIKYILSLELPCC